MSARKLTKSAEMDRADFVSKYGDRGCSCHIHPPCSFCTHPGNPICQEDDSCWEPVKPRKPTKAQQVIFAKLDENLTKSQTWAAFYDAQRRVALRMAENGLIEYHHLSGVFSRNGAMKPEPRDQSYYGEDDD